MSKQVDERIVSMRFDNKDFERNTATTMSTLDKLKEKLRFDGASKGLDNVSKAARTVDMNPLAKGVEAVQAKFSALEVMSVTALANITNSAVNAGKRIVSALTIDPVKTGFQEYETQINAVQTILANTQSKGTTIDDVNKALDELNTYADKTIYNFTEMTRNIGTFTAAGVDLETSTNAIQGIANLAAVSGSTSQQASTAMYQLSQALASGTVKLMDWNSVVNAGMGGQVFQDALKETARVQGVAIDDLISEHGSFRETLSEGWLTSEILTETLQKFTLTTEGLTEEQIKANREMLKAKGYTDKQIDSIFELGKTATDAATKVKTFTQLWDVLKESAQSGWGQTWKMIVGDYEEAKELLTPLANILTGFVNKMSDARNRVLQIALDFAAPFKSIEEKLGSVTSVTKKLTDFTDKLEYFQNVVNKVWRGDYNNNGDNPDRRDLLRQAGYDPRVVQDLVNKGYKYKLTVEDIEASHKKFGLTMETTSEETKKVTNSLEKLTDEKLKDAGLTDDEIRLYRALEKEADRLGISINDLANDMSKNNGRDMLIQSFKNIGQVFIDIGNIVKQSWVDIFNPPSLEELGVRLYGIIKTLKEFTASLRLTNSETGELNETGKKIQSTFKGIFAVLKIVSDIAGGVLKVALKLVTAVLGKFGLTLLDVTAWIGDLLVKFQKWIEENGFIAKAIDWVATGIAKLITKVIELAKAFWQLESVQNIVAWFKEAGANAIEGLRKGLQYGITEIPKMLWNLGKNMISSIMNALDEHSPSKEMFEVGKNAIQGLINGIKELAPEVWDIAKTIGSELIEKFNSIDWNNFGEVFKHIDWMEVLKLGIFMSMFKTLRKTAEGLTTTISNSVTGLVNSITALPTAITGVIGQVGSVLLELKEGIQRVSKSEANLRNSEALKNWAIALAIIAAAVIALAHVPWQKLATATVALVILAGVLIAMSWAMNKFNEASVTLNKKDGLKMNGLKTSLLGIGIVLLLLAATVKIMGTMDIGEAAQGFISLASMMTGLILFMASYDKFVKGSDAKDITSFSKLLRNVGISLLLMVAVVKLSSMLELGEIVKGTLFVGGFILFIKALMWAVTVGEKQKIAEISGLLLAVSASLLLMVGVVKLAGFLKIEDMVKGVAFVGGFILFIKALTKITSSDEERQIAKISGLLLAVSFSLLVMAAVCKLIGFLTIEDMVKGAAFISGFGLLIVALVKVTKLEKEQTMAKVGVTILAMAGAIALMALVSTLLGFVDTGRLMKGVAIVAIFAGMMSIMARQLQGAKNVTGSLVAMTAAIAIMAAAIVGLSFINPDKLEMATGALVGVMGMFTLMMYVTKSVKSTKPLLRTLLSLTAVVAVLAGIIAALSLVPNPQGALHASLALSSLMLALTGMLLILSKVKIDAAKVKSGIAGLTAMIIPMAAFALALNHIPMDKIAGKKEAIAVLTAVMLAMEYLVLATTSVSALTKKMGGSTKSGILGLVSMLGLFAAFAHAINEIPMDTIEEKKEELAILTAVMGVMSGLLIATASAGKTYSATKSKAMLGLVGMVSILAEFSAFAWALNKIPMGDIENKRDALTIITGLMMIMSLVLIATAAAGAIYSATAGFAMLGLVGMLAVLGMFIGFAAAINAIPLDKIQGKEEALTIIINVLYEITKILVVLSVLGPLASLGIAALYSIMPALAAIGVIAVALGALFTECESLQGYLDTGIDVLVRLAEGIGRVIGAFISSLAEGVTSFLPTMGQNLSDFMTNAEAFVSGVNDIKEGMAEKVGILAGAVLILAGANFIARIADLITIGPSFAHLGNDLSDFMTNAKPFLETAGSVDSSVYSSVSNLAKALLVITASELISGIKSLLTGGLSFSTFSLQFKMLGVGLRAFLDEVGSLTETDLQTAKNASEAVGYLAEAASKIPNSGGLLGLIVGNNDLGAFADQFSNLGEGLKSLVNSVGEFPQESVDTIQRVGEAIGYISLAAKDIPNSGGLLGTIFGNNDLGTFADQFANLGTGLSGLITAVPSFTEDNVKTVENVSAAITHIAKAADKIPNSGGWLGKILGENNLSDFGSQLPGLGAQLWAFVQHLGSFTEQQATVVSFAADAIVSLATASEKLPTTGGWLQKIVGEKDLGNFSGKLGNLGEGVKAFADKVKGLTADQIASVQVAVNAVASLASLAGADLKSSAKNLPDFGSSLEQFGACVASFGWKLVSDIDSESLSTAVTNAKNVVAAARSMSFSSESASKLPELGGNLETFGAQIASFGYKLTKDISSKSLDSALTNVNTILDMVETFPDLDTSKLTNFGKSLETMAGNGITAFVNKFSDKSVVKDIKGSAKKVITNFVNGLKDSKDALKTGVSGVVEIGATAASTKLVVDKYWTAGRELGSGLVAGINSMKTAVYNAGYSLGQEGVRGVEKGQDSHSPSKLTIQDGKWLGEGLIIGIGQMVKSVYNAGHNMGETAANTISKSISNIVDMMESDIDYQPTIRPVLDLSDVRSGASSISGMFPGKTLSINTKTIGSISADMAAYQNGRNSDDVVSVMKALRSDIANMPRENININGITYDDGSNIADAVKTIVRAVLIEGRV